MRMSTREVKIYNPTIQLDLSICLYKKIVHIADVNGNRTFFQIIVIQNL